MRKRNGESRKPKRTKEQLIQNFECKKVLDDLPEQDKICGTCGAAFTKIGATLVRGELVIIPERMFG